VRQSRHPRELDCRAVQRLTALTSVLVIALALASCGGGDSGGGGGGSDLTGATLTKNLEAAGYTVKAADEGALPTTIGSFATDTAAGFQQGYTVTGKGLDQPDPTRIANVVTVLLYKDGDEAKKAFDQLGGQTDNRKLAGNGIYMYGGGVNGTPSPKLQPAIDAAQG
jgi:hypothetical protein